MQFMNNVAGLELPVLAVINPASLAVGNSDTVWFPMFYAAQILAIVQTGVLGAGATVDAKLRQAKDSSGTGAKDIVGMTITQIVKATGDNKQVSLSFKSEGLDRNGDFTHVGLRITVGVAASMASAVVIAADMRILPSTGYELSSVVQRVY